jgi:hypothetical protein
MSNMDNISEQLFAKIRGRFPSVTIGDENGVVTDEPKLARYFDFDYKVGEDSLGKVSVSLTEKEVAVTYNNTFVSEQPDSIKGQWYDFLKELRVFSKRNMLNFDTRDITKSNLDKRDYQHLTKTAGDKTMSESKMYGTSRTSYEDVDKARLVLKHTQPVNMEVPGARTQHVHSIYIESDSGERFKYPFRHLNGARALARHVSEGGNLYDDFGKHIVSLSEELSKLRQFKTYMNRSAVMAEGLKGYMDLVNERLDTIKTEVMKLQRANHYAEAIKDFSPVVMEEVPEELQNSWIDELTIRTFNEELKSVFPYINKLVSEKNKIQEVGPSDMGMNKYGLSAVHKDGKFYSYRDGKQTGGPFDSMEELAKHQEELIKDEAMGHEGGSEAHAHRIYIDGDYDEDRGISEKDCEEMEYACGKAGIKCKCEPDEMRQGGVVIHTMAPRDEVIDALDKEGYAVEEAYNPEAEFENELSMIVGETEDALINGEGKDQEAAIKKLNGLMATEFQAGVNGNNAVMSLKGVIDDPMLLDMFKQVGQKESTTDVRPLVVKYVKAKAPSIINKIDTGDLEQQPTEEIKDKEDYEAKRKALQDIQMDPNTHKDEKLKKELMKKKHELSKQAIEKGFKEGEQGRKFDKYGAMVSMPNPDDKMAELNDAMNQIKLADHLAKAANVNRKNVYFDDADLVWGSKTVINSALVDKELTFADAVDELKSFADANPKAESDDTIDVKMNPDGSIEKDKQDDRSPGEKLEELVKSHYDYTTNSFPKGETAIITACEKEFGDRAIPFAEKMIERLKAGKDREMERIKHLAGV